MGILVPSHHNLMLLNRFIQLTFLILGADYTEVIALDLSFCV